MQFKWMLGALALSGAWVLGCGGDDILYAPDSGGVPHGDASGTDVTVNDSMPPPDAGHDAPVDAGPDATDAGEAGPPERLLLSNNASSGSELVVVDLASRAVAGRLSYPGSFGTTDAKGKLPFLLEQDVDVVAELDPYSPWKPTATWNVALTDAPDGGAPYSDP